MPGPWEFEANLINKLLKEHYGVDTSTGLQMWIITYSDDQVEKQFTNMTDGGIELLYPEVREVKKYPWIEHKYILEHLVATPEANLAEIGAKVSYNCIFPFENARDNSPLPPLFEMAKFVIDTVHASMYGNGGLAKYVQPSNEQEIKDRLKRISEMEEYLFGHVSGLGGTTVTGESIIVPNKQFGDL